MSNPNFLHDFQLQSIPRRAHSHLHLPNLACHARFWILYKLSLVLILILILILILMLSLSLILHPLDLYLVYLPVHDNLFDVSCSKLMLNAP